MTVPPAKRRIAICADDFGLSEAACRSILELGKTQAITATSCAVDGPFMQRHAAALAALRPRLTVGLHLNLTENPNFAGNQSLSQWILGSYLRRPKALQGLAGEVDRQLARFETLLAGAPDFVDGHEHVHQLPVVRDILLAAMQRRYGHSVLVRCTWPRHFRGGKAAVIALLGASALREAARRGGLTCNRDFAGVYDLRSRSGYAARMEEWLRNLDDGGLVMCHPEEPTGPALTARHQEHRFFSSPEWPRLLRSWNVALTGLRAA
jgi:predicted glycoside hydrolase/deacetylase ChbG (UPF0249 family)